MKPMKLLAIPALIAALAGSAVPLLAAEPAPANTAALPSFAFEKYTLPNGLDVILLEDHKLPIVTVNIWYHVGPANEAPGLTGFAHLFEHMMFAGTRHIPRGLADKLLEGAGVTDSNGSTDFDRTNYFDTVPSNQLELALWTHSDRMGYLLDVLDQTALSNQQDVVRNERRQSFENRPYGIVEEALSHQLFDKTHPYYANVIGSHADIQSAKLADVRQFFSNYYGPNNASLVVAGDIDKVKARALVAKYFASFKRGPDVAKPKVGATPITSERRAVVTDQVELPRVFMGWLTSPAYTPGDAELSVAAQILAGGKSSRLYKSLVYDKQIAQDVNANQNSNALTSTFLVDVTARPGHGAQEIEAALDEQLQLLRTEGPSEKEVERARNTIETAMLSGVEKIGGAGLANQMNQYNQYLGDPGYLAKDILRVRAVTAADVRRVAATQLQNTARAVVVGLPGKQELGPEVPTPAPVKAESGKNAGKNSAINADEPWRKHPPKAGPAPAIALPKGESFSLSNGLTVIHRHNPALPLVAAELVVKAGSDLNPLDQPGLASYTAQMLEEGSSTRSAPQIADEIAQLGAFFGMSSAPDASRASLVALKGNFGQALDVLADVVLHPAFPEAEVERQRASRLGELRQQRENATAVASVVGAAALYGPGHPYGYAQLGSEESIKATTRAQLQAFWQRYFLPNNAALVVTGAIGREELRALAEAKFGAWQRGAIDAPPAGSIVPTKARMVLVDKPGAPQTALRLMSLGPARNTPDYAANEVMNAIFGGNFTSRLNNNLREEKGYSYGVYSGFQYRRGPGPFVIAGSVRTDVTGPALAETFKEVKTMIARPVKPAELNYGRNSQVLSLPGLFETNRAVGASLANTFLYDLGLDYYSELPKQIMGVTAAQVQAAAAKYLAPEKLIVIGVGDRAKIDAQLKPLKLDPIELRDADGKLK